ncbi:MAG: livG, partial [Acidimicrobiia bacterium]|nr:livG [Acidimicrobiia bacterium]
FTRFGSATRAAAETEVGALVSGLSPERLALANWMIASVVAGLAGVLIAPLVSLIPGTYTLFIVPALAAAVLGRFTYIMPAVLGGLLVGLLQSETVFLRGRHQWLNKWTAAELVPLALVLALLVVRGRPLPTRGTLIQQTLGRAPRPRSFALPAAGGVAIALVLLFTLQGSYRSGLIVSFITAIVALSLVVVTGYVGQISLAQLTLAGVAGFTLSTFADSWGIPFPIAPILASLVATVVGVVVGLPALRIRGLLVAVVTLTLAVALEAVWFRNNAFNGGSGGKPIPNPRLFGINLGIGSGDDFPRPAFGILCLAVLVAVAIAVAKLRTSRLGSAMLAVRANERSAAAAGISVVRVKLAGFAIGAFIAGLGGCLLAYKQTNVTFDAFNSFAGLALFSFVFLAGITSVSGGIVAGLLAPSGLFVIWIGRAVDVGDWYGIVSGLGVVLSVIKNPEGLVGPAHQLLDRRRLRRVDTAASESDASPPTETFASITSGQRTLRPESKVLLASTDLSVRYGGVLAVDQACFSVRQGEIVGLIGPNGAGKTTAMDALCGFVDYQGKVVLEDRPLEGLAPHRRAAAGLGRTFQGIDLYEDLSVEENVVVGQYMGGRTDGDHLKAVLDLLGLARYRERNVRELSQGQRQLISIARALAGRPKLLLLDEPAAGLDTTESAWLAERLHQVRDSGVTLLLVDHDMSLVLGLCDTINVLDFGQVVATGNPAEIRQNPVVAEAYLGATHAHGVNAS